ncbi:PAS domain S-box-containing protein/diguanylate cyclase (GGDEF) domain-containing protein [Desulfuromusa kysingii]|uniref:PAS domain S-box-containing protein/diguanylate cyclase (GGDEF) domain-containing protein n=1 Tax=Desulfuromusa kysingii TaxID=37625 RepID=A0A1H3ZNV2_9BACT|nr:EAL domain-containing protein [Desulfuromusa kysingii]SEA24912.1 PAS domain S-box-containing protein/diguanylate cyclase (GGDEF) domain-containing protein [Desulfuromusa kysingii]
MEPRKSPTILTIDDEENIRDGLRMFLEDYDYRVIEARNGQEGLEIFAREKPDLVLCDLRMPEVDGLEVIEKIKSASPDTPIIVVSGTGVIGDAIEAIRCGAWNYLLKPIQDMPVLLHAINQALERSRLIIENRVYQEHLEEEVTRRTHALQKAVKDLNQSNVKLKNSEQKYRLIFDNLQDVYLEMRLDGTITEISPSISHISQYHREEIINQNIDKIFPSLRDRERLFDRLRADNKIYDYELHLQDKDATLIPCSLNASYQQGSEQTGDKLCATLRDVTDRKLAEAKIQHLAFYDALTELPNRRLLLDRLEQNISRARRYGHYGAMLFLDLDRFKNINDSLGHPVGDSLLKAVSAQLLKDLRSDDTVSRLGGDEFVMLLSDLGNDPTVAAARAQQKAEHIKVKLSEKNMIDGHELHITPSIGVAMFPAGKNSQETGDDILRYADTAMYRAKDDGRDTIRFFLPSMQAAADNRLAIEKELRHALDRGELSLNFQPQVNSRGTILGAETLVRWKHPEKGYISPATFIPIAEATGLILPIGEWVLQTACEHLKDWNNQGLSVHHLAVNVSPRQFRQPNFISQVQTILDKTGADPRQLGLELTEGMVIDNILDTIEKMEALKKMGIELSIDDFGTGYSSLTYLKKMPLDILKIDQSFVHDIETDSNDAAIVDTIISMATHLDLKVIAEGVETKYELEFLEGKGCPLFQGYLFSKPVANETFVELLKTGKTQG